MPQALPYIYLAAAALGTYTAMESADTQAKQQEANRKYQAAQTAADAAAAAGAAQVEADRIRKAAKAQRAQATAAAAASGIDVSSPTAVRLNETITASSEEDALLTIINGGDQAARMRNQAYVDRQGASLVRSEARAQNTGTLLSAAASTAQGWKSMRGNGG